MSRSNKQRQSSQNAAFWSSSVGAAGTFWDVIERVLKTTYHQWLNVIHVGRDYFRASWLFVYGVLSERGRTPQRDRGAGDKVMVWFPLIKAIR